MKALLRKIASEWDDDELPNTEESKIDHEIEFGPKLRGDLEKDRAEEVIQNTGINMLFKYMRKIDQLTSSAE